MAGARHIVQSQPLQAILLSEEPPPAPQSTPSSSSLPPPVVPGGGPLPPFGGFDELQLLQQLEAARLFDERPDMYAMEFMRFGDAHSLLVKRAAQQTRFRSEELWMVFECRKLVQHGYFHYILAR